MQDRARFALAQVRGHSEQRHNFAQSAAAERRPHQAHPIKLDQQGNLKMDKLQLGRGRKHLSEDIRKSIKFCFLRSIGDQP